jgi:hypothetical protein
MPPLREVALPVPPPRPLSLSPTVEDLPSVSEFEVPGLSKARLVWAVGIAVAFAFVASAAWWALPGRGRLAIDVVDSKGRSLDRVAIFVDGTKECDTARCIVDGLRAGGHGVRTNAGGYETPPMQTLMVQAGNTVATTITARSTRGGFRVAGVQTGVKLYVDGKEVGPLPQEVDDLEPGDHLVRIVGEDRLEPLEMHQTVRADQIADLGTISLRVLTEKADAEADKKHTVTMRPNPLLVATESAEPKAPPATASRETGASEPAPAAAAGFVTINSIPPSDCYLDGNALGSTPKVRVAVAVGTHVIKFVSAEHDLAKTISINVGPGETKPAVAKLE